MIVKLLPYSRLLFVFQHKKFIAILKIRQYAIINPMIEIDGSYLESGGQILRTAMALSAITQQPCHVFNIRKKRPKPGLAHQHILGLKALSEIYNGKLEGDFLNSEDIKFWPEKIKSSSHECPISINARTAASITLMLQGLILPALFASIPTKISFNGGATDTFFSPTIDHFQYVFLKILQAIGIEIELDIEKRGFYPQGGAKVIVHIKPMQISKSKPLSLLERGTLKKVLIISGASENLKKKKVAERQISGAKQILGKLNFPLETKIEYYSGSSTGSQINIIAELENTFFGTDNLGKLGKSAEAVGTQAAQEFIKQASSNACLDKHTADQILPYMALLPDKSQVTVSEITNHCKTNIWIIEKFIKNGRFAIEKNKISWT